MPMPELPLADEPPLVAARPKDENQGAGGSVAELLRSPLRWVSPEDRPWLLAYVVCELLALAAIWGHRYMPGVDMPQHANTMRLWVELRNGPPEYASLYRTNLFTPYLLTYALAYPFAKLFGGMVALKVILSIAVLGAPWTMARWLRAVGGEPFLALFSFPVLFGFAFFWGFLSHILAMGLLFGFLASFERQGERPTWSDGLETTSWGILLFFCHGITFGIACLTAGLRIVVRKRPLAAFRAGLTLVPMATVALLWMATRQKEVTEIPHADTFVHFTLERASAFFSSFFVCKGSHGWAAVGLTVVVVFLAVTRPRCNRSLGVWLPFVLSLGFFFILPNWVADTAVVGPRFCVYAQAFACGLLVAAKGRERLLERSAWAVAAASLVLLNVRLYRFNQELDGMRALSRRVGPYADVQSFMPNVGGFSSVFGFRNLSQAPAWITAENGGLVEGDYARYYQMPIQHQHQRFPDRYRYIFTLTHAEQVKKAFPDAELRGHSGKWWLYERPPLHTGPVSVVRSAQAWGSLLVDRSVVDKPLTIGGTVFEHGLGTHASSFARVEVKGGGKLAGAYGLDDTSFDDARVVFQVRSGTGKVLFRSGVVKKGVAAQEFSVDLGSADEALLETFSIGPRIAGAHSDWVSLRSEK